MFVYKWVDCNQYEIGYYKPDGEWYCVKTITNYRDGDRECQQKCHWLNGGY